MELDLFGRLRLIFNVGRHARYERYFRNEYLRMSGVAHHDSSAPKITVNIVDRLPAAGTGDIVRSVRCKKLFRFNYLVRGVKSSNVQIFFCSHFVDRVYINAIAVFLQAQVLEPVMYLKLLEVNVLLMHAGGVCDEKSGYLFPAYGGTGKTTFSIALLNLGYKLLGDDLLMVDVEERNVYPYPRPLHLFTYNINNLNGARVPLSYRLAIYSKNVLRYALEAVLRTDFLISTRVHADEIYDHDPFGNVVPYKGLYFLVKEGPRTCTREVNGSNRLDLAREIVRSADLNVSLYDLLSDNDEVTRVMRLEENIMQRLLEHVGKVTYVNTRMLDLTDLSAFVREHFRLPAAPVN